MSAAPPHWPLPLQVMVQVPALQPPVHADGQLPPGGVGCKPQNVAQLPSPSHASVMVQSLPWVRPPSTLPQVPSL